MDAKNDLFLLAHHLVESNPENYLSWFAVGAYYFCSKKYDQCRKYLRKSLSIQRNFLDALILLGHSFSEQDEFDQALTLYRTASRLFKK
jgi:anaphase-promoting complex subunit 6